MFIAEDGTARYPETVLATYQTTRCQPRRSQYVFKIQTGSGTHLAFYAIGIRFFTGGGKAAGV